MLFTCCATKVDVVDEVGTIRNAFAYVARLLCRIDVDQYWIWIHP